MKIAVSVSTLLCAAVLSGGASGVQAQGPPLPPGATLFASGLEGPRGLAFGEDGTLYVAEAGLGGTTSTVGKCPQVPAPLGPDKGGLTARISKIDTGGHVSTLSSGLPSTVTATGDVLGVADLAFLEGKLYAVLAGGGCSHGNPTFPNSLLRVNLNTGKWHRVADLSDALMDHPAKYTSADDYEPDGTWYGLISYRDRLYTVEPNHGQVFSISEEGQVRQVIDVSASQGHIVPTSIVADDGLLYVGNLNLFPIDPQWAKIMTIAKDIHVPNSLPGFDGPSADFERWKIVSSKAGFTTIVSMKVGPDGLLYVLELSTKSGFPTGGAGKVVRVRHSGVIEDVVTGLTVPTGMTFGPDGRLYVSNLGAAGGSVGQILRFEVPSVH
jgi:hypothetical protein